MIMKYEWLHFWKTFEIKMSAIFGKPKDEKDRPDVLVDADPDEPVWTPGESIQRFNDPDFQENVKKL